MISIIMVCKDSEATIKRSIASLLGQSFSDWELVVKDGGSRDGTLSIVREFQDQRIKLIEQPDRGISDAFNQAIERSEGDFLLFLNSDDRFIAPSSLEAFLSALGGSLAALDRQSGAYYGKVLMKNHPLGIASLGLPNQNTGVLGYYRWPYPHQALLVARKLFDRFGNFDTTLRYTMDYDWLVRVVEQVKPQFVDIELVEMDGGGVSNRLRWRTHWERFKVLQRRRGPIVAIPWLGYALAGEVVLGLRQAVKMQTE